MFDQVLIDLLSGFRRYPCIPRKFWKRWYSLGIDNNYFDVSSERCFRCLVHSWLQKKTMQQRRHYQNFCRITGSNCNNGQVSFYSRSLYFSTFLNQRNYHYNWFYLNLTIFSFVLSILSACGLKSFGGIALDAEIQTSNMNFYKATEGFLESLPQATVQLSYVLRSSEPPSKYIKFRLEIITG